MKYFACLVLITITLFGFAGSAEAHFYKATNPNIKYVGRVLFNNRFKPKFWSAGVYVQAKFEGTSLKIIVDDQELNGDHNYLELVIDNQTPRRIQTTGRVNHITVADSLAPGEHTFTLCKDTESGIGYIEFVGLACDRLLPMDEPSRKIEYIGDSITGGTGADESVIKCDKGKWYDQHNAYMSYGPLVSRALNSQWVLSQVAGIGVIHSCCNIKTNMPEVFDKVNMRNDSVKWNFKGYTPNVVTICLGQNDGKQDSVAFCSTYVQFIRAIRSTYPNADIVCLSSPMAAPWLTALLHNYITGIQQYLNNHGDKKVTHFFFSRSYNDGCGGHPSLAQHQLIANELAPYIKGLENW